MLCQEVKTKTKVLRGGLIYPFPASKWKGSCYQVEHALLQVKAKQTTDCLVTRFLSHLIIVALGQVSDCPQNLIRDVY